MVGELLASKRSGQDASKRSCDFELLTFGWLVRHDGDASGRVEASGLFHQFTLLRESVNLNQSKFFDSCVFI